jgi:hypothetical protein
MTDAPGASAENTWGALSDLFDTTKIAAKILAGAADNILFARDG